MTIKRTILVAFASLAFALSANAQPCDIDISIANITKGDAVPGAISSKLEGKLTVALAKAGLTACPYDSRFFIAGRFDDAFNDVTGGPSPKNIVKTTLTIYVGDADEQKVFSSESFELKGVGSTEQMAYQRALNSINGSNRTLIDFIAAAKQKIIDYYDANYTTYINNARQKMAARNYDEALYYVTAIPACCKGYDEAHALALQIFSQRCSYEGTMLLAKARGAWAADPTASGAEAAFAFLSQIDPNASCYAEAMAFGEKVSKESQKQWEFENVQKYKDEREIERMRIEAAKEIAVTYAKNRPKVVNRYHFVYARYW